MSNLIINWPIQILAGRFGKSTCSILSTTYLPHVNGEYCKNFLDFFGPIWTSGIFTRCWNSVAVDMGTSHKTRELIHDIPVLIDQVGPKPIYFMYIESTARQ